MSPARTLRILEVAALPFPSRQGTQVLVDAIGRGLAELGHDVHLLVYAHGAFPLDAPYRVHRLGDLPRFRSLRSGPDLRRVALDLRLALALRRLAADLHPDVVHLHNVEAAAAALFGPDRPHAPCVYHAHALMEHELPSYGRSGSAFLARRLGRFLDASLVRRADLTLAVSEPTRDGLLAAGADPDRLRTVEPGVDLEDLADPIPVRDAGPAAPHPTDAPATPGLAGPAAAAGRPLRFAHLGNLDRCQGIDRILDALAVLRSRGMAAELVVVTASDPAAVLQLARRVAVPARFVPHGPLAGALDAVRGCAAAVLARTIPGGFPIKLLALLRAGVPIASTPTAVERLGVDDVLWKASGDDAGSLADALLAAATDPTRAARAEAGMRLATTHFSRAAAAARLEPLLGSVRRRT